MTRLQLFLTKKWASLKHRNLRREDTWFHSHFVTAANEIGDHLSRFVRLNQSRVLDFGCGDGFTALGVTRFNTKEIVGVDLTLAYSYLPEISRRYLGMDTLPNNLSFQQVAEGEPLPFENGSFDAIYTWSVLEHVQDVDYVMHELYRILESEGILFIQIEPLYHSPFGSHLQRLIPEPWAHLTMAKDAFLERAWNAPDQVRDGEKDLAYRKNAFIDFKKFLISEYQNLNRITAGELEAAAQNSGFNVIAQEKRQGHPYRPPAELLEQYPAEDLLTNDMRLTLQKPG
jgi:SAM-dependent methyltransferase